MCVRAQPLVRDKSGASGDASYRAKLIAAIQFALAGDDALRHCRSVEIMADAAHAIFTRQARDCTGNFFIDDIVLSESGVTDSDQYRVDPTKDLMPDFFVPANTPFPAGVTMGPVVK